MNPSLQSLQSYPFEKLAELFKSTTPAAGKPPIAWSIGEPKHPAPEFIHQVISRELSGLSNYPMTAGMPELRQAIVDWLYKRFSLQAGSLLPDASVLPVNGTREALFAFCHFIVNPVANALVLMPNPFYQIYEGAALLSGAKPWYINLRHDGSLLPDFKSVPREIWMNCQLLYICSPGNPTGAVMSLAEMQELIAIADEFDFVLASDECYSEIYPDENAPPCGLLQACAALGRNDYRRCVVFHSLSKRSSLPGMRSGFVAGDAKIIKQFKKYRTYHGCAMPPPFQKASIAAWRDEDHVKNNRALYRQKIDAVLDIISPVMEVKQPAGSFYLWARTPYKDTDFARDLFAKENLTVLPGSFLSRDFLGQNPGENYVRMALVGPQEECIDGANRLRQFLHTRKEGQ